MIFSAKNPVVRCMVKLFYLVLGQIVSVSNEDKLNSNCLIVANKVSSLEGIFFIAYQRISSSSNRKCR